VGRWIARLPVGADQPLVQLRLGSRNPRAGAGHDFLNVATPLWSYRSPFEFGQEIAERVQQIIGPVSVQVLCAHDGHKEAGSSATMAIDGRGVLLEPKCEYLGVLAATSGRRASPAAFRCRVIRGRRISLMPGV